MRRKRWVTIGITLALMAGSSGALAAENVDVQSGGADVYEMDDTIVTAERMPSKTMETPANVAVITAKEIEANHFSSLDEAIGHVNGVSVVRGAGGERQYVRINGDDRVVIMVDGQRLNTDQGELVGRSSVDMNMLPTMENIQRIEVVKGGGSALYGSDAVGGVINIITKKVYKNQTKIDMNTGSWNTHNYEITTQGKENDFSWLITGGIQRRGHYDYKFDGKSPTMENSDYNNNSFSMKLNNRFSDAESLTAYYAHRSIDSGLWNCYGTTSEVPGIFAGVSARMQENFNNYSLTWNFKEDTEVPAYVRLFYNEKTVNMGGSDPITFMTIQHAPFTTQTQGIDYQDGWKLSDKHTLVAGAEWHESKSSNSNSGYKNGKTINKSVYVQDSWQLSDRWILVPGLRMDNHSKFGTHWSPKIALNYLADKDTHIYASWGRVFKAPTADDLYTYLPGGWSTLGNPDLKPETGYTATLGMDHNFDENISAGVSFFYTELNDAIAWPQVSPSVYVAQNVNKEKRTGMELSFKQKLSPMWSYDLGYSYIRREIDKNNGSGMVLQDNLQPNGYKIGLHYNSGAWKANLLGTIGSGLNEYYYNGNSSYNIWDFNLSYEVNKELTTYFKVNNLTNQEYYEDGASMGWGPASYYPCGGRFYQVGFNLTF